MTDRLYENMLNADTKPFSKRLGKKSLNRDVFESNIDFPRVSLDPVIWIKKDDTYTLRVGSIGTNQQLSDSDVDVHIVPKNLNGWDEKNVKKVIDWFNNNRDEIDGWIGKHPIEVYIQLNLNQDLMSDSCYDLLQNKWLVGPKIVPMSTDPYDDFSHIAQDIKNSVEDADKLFSELKRDVIDFEVIKQAMGEMSGKDKERLLQKLQSKLKELEDGIEALYKERGEWVSARHNASKPVTPEQALKDVKLAKNWKDINATFKFINRYQYLKIINNLEKLLDDEKISLEEVPIIKRIMRS